MEHEPYGPIDPIRLLDKKYNPLQVAIMSEILAMKDHGYAGENDLGNDVADDMRHIIRRNAERVLEAFQGQESFSVQGHEDLIHELARQVLERAPHTKGEW